MICSLLNVTIINVRLFKLNVIIEVNYYILTISIIINKIMQKIIVTGGLGFIGSNLIELLIHKKFKVINVDKVTYSSNFYNTKEYKKNPNYIFIKCDLNNKNKLSKIIFKYKPIGIFNLAAETHVDRSIDGPESFIRSNILGVFNLLEIFRKYSKTNKKTKLIHISTD